VVRYRAEHGMSQRELAAETGLAQPAIARLEQAGHQPSLETLAKLSLRTEPMFFIEIADGTVGLREKPRE
jgi:transcriptional regulator with XRE-family HTH domain